MATEKEMMDQLEEAITKPETGDSLREITEETYYRRPEQVKFLLIDNLALKSLLVQKGMITPEEFKVAKEKATEILEAKVKEQVEEWMKVNPLKVLFDIFNKDSCPDTSEEEARER